MDRPGVLFGLIMVYAEHSLGVAFSLERLFAPLAGEYGAVWLDSSYRLADRGRYSFIARRPSLDIAIDGAAVTILREGESPRLLRGVDGLDMLQQLWNERRYFSVGYITYEAALPFVAPEAATFDPLVPGIRFLFYDSVLQLDHDTGRIGVSNPSHDNYDDVLNGLGTSSRPRLVPPAAELVQGPSCDDYCRAVEAIKGYIHEGDIYQANFTTRFDVASDARPFEIYTRLRQLNPAPYGAFLNFGEFELLSSSPERMFLKDDRRVTTGPIKGTIARGDSSAEETASTERLLASEKDRAELLMIVDLARNDLGRVAEIGSVRVDSLFRPEIYSSVIHLVGDIRADIADGVNESDIVRALLPGGSITGAPKRRAVEIIGGLETTPRSVYTGCIGYVYGDRADFNIAIRTMLHAGNRYHVHAGGGIVADSVPEAEYEEMCLKARNLLRALGVRQEANAWRK